MAQYNWWSLGVQDWYKKVYYKTDVYCGAWIYLHPPTEEGDDKFR